MAIKAGSKVDDVVDAVKTTNKIVDTKGGTYLLKDADGNVMRTGRSGDLATREVQHGRAEQTKDLKFEVDKRTNDYAEQRGREQVIHEKHNPPLNKIRPISPKNPNRQKYLDSAKKLEDK